MNEQDGKRPFGEYIRRKRLDASLTQRELAARLFVTESTVSKWERALSYPDVSMVPAICRELHISEHEFFTACDDDGARAQAKEAAVRRGVTKGLFWFFAAGYAAAIVACFICDLAVFRALDWFWIVLAALLLAFSLTNLPALVKRNRLPVCLGAATGSLLLLLLACWLYTGQRWVIGGGAITAVCLALPWGWWAIWRFYGRHVPPLCMAFFSAWVFALLAVIRAFTGGDWLLGLAYPIAVLCVGYAWLYFAVVHWLPAGAWLKTGLCAVLTALAVPLVNSRVAALLPGHPKSALADYFTWSCIPARQDINGTSWVNVLVFAILLGVSLVLLAAGVIAEARRRQK